MSPLGEDKEGMEGLKQQTPFLKQDTVDATWNALQLGDQSKKVADIERPSDALEGHSQSAEDNTVMMKQLNRFHPSITFNSAKQAAQEAKVQTQYEEREEAETQNRLGRATTYGIIDQDNKEGIGGSRTMKTGAQLLMRKEQRKRFQFEAAASDGEMEDELDENLDENSEMMKRLKALKSEMEQELDRMQTNCLTPERQRISETNLANIAKRNAEKLQRIK